VGWDHVEKLQKHESQKGDKMTICLFPPGNFHFFKGYPYLHLPQ
jgi:hypothetical protein